MYNPSINQASRHQSERQLLNKKLGFSAAYLCVQSLQSYIGQAPETITRKTVAILIGILNSNRYENKKQSYFLYKNICQVLIDSCIYPKNSYPLLIILRLQKLLLNSKGKKQRAISEGLGSLPLNIKGPQAQPDITQAPLKMDYDQFLSQFDFLNSKRVFWQGRTLIFSLPASRNKRIDTCQFSQTEQTGFKKIGCLKFMRNEEDVPGLITEIFWIDHLNKNSDLTDANNHVPIPIMVNKNCLFKISNPPEIIKQHKQISDQNICIAYITNEQYFHYPNEPDYFEINDSSLERVFKKNARQLGQLSSQGIIHTALIPLFHNRTQQHRRQDQGQYNWEQAGRLDQWLGSSKYPNFAKSGLRDFEHLISVSDTKKLHHYIGEHLLSFILVAGSFFRHKQPNTTGFDKDGNPLDLQHLFDKSLFKLLLKGIVQEYYYGLTGLSIDISHLINDLGLIDRLIETMGIDEHMEEIFHVQDQNGMEDFEFLNYLNARGVGALEINTIQKGNDDIVLHTGPHLGGFNQTISVPELINFLFCLSSLCISDRYLKENRLKAS